MKNKEDIHLATPLSVGDATKFYNIWGRVAGYKVTVRYHMSKAFSAISSKAGNTKTDEAESWVSDMQKDGCKLLYPPVYECREHNSILVSAYILCERTYYFKKLPFFNSKSRSSRFVAKVRSECDKLDDGFKRMIYAKYENTK